MFPTLDDGTVTTINAPDYTTVGRMVHVYLNFTSGKMVTQV